MTPNGVIGVERIIKTLYLIWRLDAILNISVISNATVMKFHSIMKDLKMNTWATFSMLWAVSTKYLTKQYSKMVVRKPSWIFQSSQTLHSRKFNFTWSTLEETTQQNSSFFIMRFDEIINKIVIQDGGPNANLNISVIQKTTFIKI